ncbi:MAG: YicC/YloC family endoribonuclease [Planctomycetota bacterium]
MLLSMTGHGHGTARNQQAAVSVEIRSVNNRFLKTTVYGEVGADLQSQVEEAVRALVKRGTVTVRLRLERLDPEQYKLNETAIAAYLDQIRKLQHSADVPWAAILSLPGVVHEPAIRSDDEQLSQLVREAVEQALGELQGMRSREGTSMRENLAENLQQFRNWLEQVERLAPRVVENFAQRARDRIQSLLAKYEISSQPADIIREVGLFAERADIAEETVRLRSHLQQFEKTMGDQESNGRRLDFLIQEFLRETNTIGSKAQDAEIASCVVEMKTIIERVREMVQNVE